MVYPSRFTAYEQSPEVAVLPSLRHERYQTKQSAQTMLHYGVTQHQQAERVI